MRVAPPPFVMLPTERLHPRAIDLATVFRTHVEAWSASAHTGAQPLDVGPLEPAVRAFCRLALADGMALADVRRFVAMLLDVTLPREMAPAARATSVDGLAALVDWIGRAARAA